MLNIIFSFKVWPHEMEPWFQSWYRGRVETLDAKYNLANINSILYDHTNSSKRATKEITLYMRDEARLSTGVAPIS